MKLYRYSSSSYDSDNIILMHGTEDSSGTVFLHEFDSIKETPCGVWICPNSYFPEKKRFINLNCVKKYACKTIEESKQQFIKRKERQIKILQNQLYEAKESLLMINDPGMSKY